MQGVTIFEQGRNDLIGFINNEYKGFDNKLLSHFLNSFNELLDYREEGTHTKPKILFTNNIDAIIKSVPKAYKLQIFEDDDATMFSSRLKPLIAIAKKEWCIYIENKEDKFIYGICKTFNSLKEKSLITEVKESTFLRDRADKINCIIAESVSDFEMSLFSTHGNCIRINTSLHDSHDINQSQTIAEFTKDCFSKLRTTKKKLEEVHIMFYNIFTKVIEDLNGAMCVIVDKDYKDNGFFEDGIWLETPISFSKLFTQSKSYSEEKLQAFATLFINMLNFDGITVVDTTGKVLAYNVFVESNIKRTKNVIGGARKRAAYTIINSRRKHIVGVYFQSHEGEIFYKSLKKPKVVKPKVVKVTEPQSTTTPEENVNETIKPETKVEKPVEKEVKTEKELVNNIKTEKEVTKEPTTQKETDQIKSVEKETDKPKKTETKKLEIENILISETIDK